MRVRCVQMNKLVVRSQPIRSQGKKFLRKFFNIPRNKRERERSKRDVRTHTKAPNISIYYHLFIETNCRVQFQAHGELTFITVRCLLLYFFWLAIKRTNA